MPSVPAGASTLYLFASKRFGDLYGARGREGVLNRLQTLAARDDAAGGAVIPVDANGAVLSALDARAADSCSPAKANDVVRAVGNLLDNPQIVTPSVKYIVVVGDDAAGIPFGRILDNTSYANERGYASTFFGATNNQYLSTLRARLPADRRSARGHQLLGQGAVRARARGRPARRDARRRSSSQITQYIDRNGAINPTRALTTGYDFLDGRRDADLGWLQGEAGNNKRAGADHRRAWSKERSARRDVPGFEPAGDRLDQRALRPFPRRCPRTRTPLSARRSSSRRPTSQAARPAGA